MFAVHALAEESKIVFETLQELTTLLSQQHAKLSGLIDAICRMTRMIGADNCRNGTIVHVEQRICGSFVTTYNDARSFLDGIYMWVIEPMTQLEADSLHGLVVAVAKVFFPGS